jgi:hypothetical protein
MFSLLRYDILHPGKPYAPFMLPTELHEKWVTDIQRSITILAE